VTYRHHPLPTSGDPFSPTGRGPARLGETTPSLLGTIRLKIKAHLIKTGVVIAALQQKNCLARGDIKVSEHPTNGAGTKSKDDA